MRVTNAREAMGRKLAESSSQAKLLAGVARVFGLAEPPRRIEVYDNSHIQGAQPVGAMIVAGPEGFIKSQYRKFNISAEDLTPGDDFGMMREVLTRRFARLLKEHGEREPANETDPDQPQAWPDLVLIDGGQGQLNAARAVLADLGIADLCIAGVAKGPDRDAGREHFYVPEKPSFMIEARDPVLYYIQRLRDEAHRFAIGSHRAKRAKAIAPKSARRDRRYRTHPQKSLIAGLWVGQSGGAGQPCRSGKGRGGELRSRPGYL